MPNPYYEAAKAERDRRELGGLVPKGADEEPIVEPVPESTDEALAAFRSRAGDASNPNTGATFELEDKLLGKQKPIPRDIGLLEAAARALAPNVVTPDNRELSAAQRAEAALEERNKTRAGLPGMATETMLGVPFGEMARDIAGLVPGVAPLLEDLARAGTGEGDLGDRLPPELAATVRGAQRAGANIMELLPQGTQESIRAQQRAAAGRLAPSTNPNPNLEGVKSEATVMQLLRLMQVPEAIVTEGAQRIPAPDLSKAIASARAGELPRGGLESTLGDELSLDPGRFQRRRDDNPVKDYLFGVLERVETGRSLAEDVGAQFEDVATQDGGGADVWGIPVSAVGWGVGFAASVGTPWATILGRPVTASAGLARDATRLARVVPAPPAGAAAAAADSGRSAVVAAFTGAHADFGEHIGRETFDQLTAGRIGLDDLQPTARMWVERASLEQTGLTARELFDLEGVGRTPEPVRDPAHDAIVQQAAESRRTALKAIGTDESAAPAPAPEAAAIPAEVEGLVPTPEAVAKATPPVEVKEPAPAAPVEVKEPAAPVEVVAPPTEELDKALVVAQKARKKARTALTKAKAKAEPAGKAPLKAHKAEVKRLEQEVVKADASLAEARVALREAKAAAAAPAETVGTAEEIRAVRARIRELRDEQRAASKELVRANTAKDRKESRIAEAEAGWNRAEKALEAERDVERELLKARPARDGSVVEPEAKPVPDAEPEAKPVPDAEPKAADPAPAPDTSGLDPDALVAADARVTRRARSSTVDTRPELPRFEKPAATMDAAWDQVKALAKAEDAPKGFYKLGPGALAKRMEGILEESPDDLAFVLRNPDGSAIGKPMTYEDAMLQAARRRIDGDEVWRGSHRRVGGWATKLREGETGVRWAPDYLFATDVEAALAKNAVPDPVDLRRLKRFSETAQGKAELVVGKALAEAAEGLGDAAKTTKVKGRTSQRGAFVFPPWRTRRAPPAGALIQAAKGGATVEDLAKVGDITSLPPRGPAEEVLRMAFRQFARDQMGTEKFVYVQGAAVTRYERKTLVARVNKKLGMTAEEAVSLIVDGKGKLPEATVSELGRLIGFKPGDDLDLPAWQRAHRAALAEELAKVGDARYMVRGVRPMATSMLDAWKTAGTDQRAMSRAGKAWDTFLDLAGGRLFMVDVTARMPEPTAAAWKQHKLAMGRNLDDLAGEMRDVISERKISKEHALAEFIEQSDLVHPELLEEAAGVLDAPMGTKPDITNLRKVWRGPRPMWLDTTDPVLSGYGVHRWARDTTRKARDRGRQWVEANLIASTRGSLAPSTMEDILDNVDDAALLRAYREYAFTGETRGPQLTAIFESAGEPLGDAVEAQVLLAAMMRGDAQTSGFLDKLVKQGLVVPAADPRANLGLQPTYDGIRQTPVLHAVARGTHKTVEPSGRTMFHYPPGDIAWAEHQLSRWGIDPGSRAALVTAKVAGGEFVLPRYLHAELESMVRSGTLDSRMLLGSEGPTGRLYDNLMKLYKESLTHGVVNPSPHYMMGQLVGALSTSWTTVGPARTASASWEIMTGNAGMVGELTKRAGSIRLGAPAFRPRNPHANIIITAAGEVYHVDDLEKVAMRNGLFESRTDFETAAQVGDVLKQAEGGAWGLDWTTLKRGIKWEQEQVRRFAGAVDVNFRNAIFVDEVKRGTPLDMAAQVARKAQLDYRDLTPFEAKWMRGVFTFYAFLRKNMDAYATAMLTHPDRVLGQARLAHGSVTYSGLTNVEIGNIRDDDINRLSVINDREIVNDKGRPHPLYAMDRITTTPAGVGEWLGEFGMMAAPFGMASEDSEEKALGAVVPLGQVLALILLERKLDREVTSPFANRVPPILMDVFPDKIIAGLGVYPVAVSPTRAADADPSASDKLGVPAVWVVGADPTLTKEEGDRKRLLWQELMVFASKPVNQANKLAIATGLGQVPSHQTQSEATMQYLFGLTSRPVADEQQVDVAEAKRKNNALRMGTQLPR